MTYHWFKKNPHEKKGLGYIDLETETETETETMPNTLFICSTIGDRTIKFAKTA